MEAWKPIPSFSGYEVSDLGRVRSYRVLGRRSSIASIPQRILKPGCNGAYRSVSLRRGKIGYSRRIARLVLEAFVGPCPEGMERCHNDSNPENDRLDNLRYDTHANNCRDGFGEHTSRLTKQESVQLREMASQGVSDKELASRFNTSTSKVGRCRRGETYRYAKGPLTRYNNTGGKRLSVSSVEEMRKLAHEQNASLATLAERFRITESSVSLIIRGLRRKKDGGPLSLKRHYI